MDLSGLESVRLPLLGVRETRGIEVKLHVSFFCPFHPTLEMFYLHLVAVHKLSAELSVSFMEIQTHVSCEKTRNLVNVLTQLVDIACFAGIITCGLNTARSSFVALKTHNVISLPAMQRDRSSFKCFDSLIGINSKLRVTRFSKLVSFFICSSFMVVCFYFLILLIYFFINL